MPNRNQTNEEANKIQTAHLANMDKLVSQNKLHIAGPIAENVNLRRIFFFNVGSKKEAEELLQTDLAIKSGRLSYKIMLG